MNETDLEYDPYSYEIDLDPYPLYRRMRDEAPAYYNPKLDFWALTRFQDCHDAFLDWQTYSSAQGTVLELMGDSQFSGSLIIFMDPPKQTRYRNLVSKAFTPARMRALEPRIRAIAVEYLDRLVGLPRFDVVREFTAKLPMDVISTLLGIPKQDRDQVRGWSNDLLHRDAGNPMPTKRGLESMLKLQAYFDEQMAQRRRQPKDDMMTVLVEAEVDGEKLDANEIRGFCNLLATAGNETVTKLLASAFYWLNAFPDQRRILAAEPAVIPNAVEELLRFDPPSQYQGRTLLADARLHGRALPKGAKVMLVNGASGRDERRFPDPDRLDVKREIEFHLGFGYGRHVCLGAFLARMESRVALEEFLRRFPEYGVPEDGIERMHSSNVRGFSGLVVETA
jgi:cytochrome P450